MYNNINTNQTPMQNQQNQFQQGNGSSNNSNSNRVVVPEARQAGYIGGYMVTRLIEQAERGMAGQ